MTTTTAKTLFVKDAQGRWVIPKDPNAVLDYTWDWTKWLTKIADTIASATIVLGGGATITAAAPTHTTTAVTALLSAGTVPVDPATLESATCRIVTAGGRTDDRTIYLQIVER